MRRVATAVVPGKYEYGVQAVWWTAPTDLVEDAAIVGIKATFVEKQALLHCAVSVSAPVLLLVKAGSDRQGSRTSLEAVHGRGDLDSCREQIGQCGKGHREEDAQCGGGSEEETLGVGIVGALHSVHGRRRRGVEHKRIIYLMLEGTLK